MVIVGLSVIATVLVLQYHHHDPDGGHMPHWVSTSTHRTASEEWVWPFSPHLFQVFML